MVNPAVRARGITKAFGDVVALDGVDIDIEAGTVHGLVGPNGAGKTTLLGMLLGLSSADSGELEILGRPLSRNLTVPEGVAGFVDGPGLYPALTARKNLHAIARLRAYADGEVDDALARVGLTEVADDPVRGFSLGMRQRLGLAAALLGNPRLLVLDEPSNGLDPAGKRHVHRTIAALAEAGSAVVLSSHRMDDLATLCSEVSLLSTGRVVFSGPLAKLAAESGELDHRIVTSDAARAAEIAVTVDGVSVRSTRDGASATGSASEALTVRGGVPAMDALVARLVEAGVAVRELGPVTSPLEAAFLALIAGQGTTGQGTAGQGTAGQGEGR